MEINDVFNKKINKMVVDKCVNTNLIVITIEYKIKNNDGFDGFDAIDGKLTYSIDPDNLDKAINKIYKITNVSVLELFNLNIHDENIYQTMIDYFMSINNLTKIYLSGNIKIDDLISIIEKNSITKLSLVNCPELNFEELFRKLINNNLINHIVLAHNKVSTNGFSSISQYLKSTQNKIRRFEIRCFETWRYGMDQTNAFIHSIINGLMENKSLTCLDFSGDCLSTATEKLLYKVAAKNRNLQTIQYDNNKYSECKIMAGKNRKLVQIKLCMLMLRKTKDCVVSTIPRRVLIYLFAFLDQILE